MSHKYQNLMQMVLQQTWLGLNICTVSPEPFPSAHTKLWKRMKVYGGNSYLALLGSCTCTFKKDLILVPLINPLYTGNP